MKYIELIGKRQLLGRGLHGWKPYSVGFISRVGFQKECEDGIIRKIEARLPTPSNLVDLEVAIEEAFERLAYELQNET